MSALDVLRQIKQARKGEAGKQEAVPWGNMDYINDVGVENLSRRDLKNHLEARDLEVQGTRLELIERLRNSIADEELNRFAVTETLEADFLIQKEIIKQKKIDQEKEYFETIICENKNVMCTLDNIINKNDNQLKIQKEITKQKEIENKTKEIELISNLLSSYKGPLLDNILSNYFKINNNQLTDSVKNNLIDTDSDNEEINSHYNANESEESEVEDELEDDSNKCIDCDVQIMKESTRCNKCSGKLRFMNSSKDRPSYEQLKEDLKKSNYTKVGEKYKVSDNTIRKWIKKYEKYDNI